MLNECFGWAAKRKKPCYESVNGILSYALLQGFTELIKDVVLRTTLWIKKKVGGLTKS
jgi:hypothetical protein